MREMTAQERLGSLGTEVLRLHQRQDADRVAFANELTRVMREIRAVERRMTAIEKAAIAKAKEVSP